MAKKNTDKIVFDHIKVLDAGAKGVSVAKAPDGKVIFIPNVVPGDVVMCKLSKSVKPITKEKRFVFMNFQNIESILFANILVFVAAVNGKT
jgi:23S rRNA (uracil1939-C5)-methyltransferase